MLPAPWKHMQSCQPQGRTEGKGRQGLCQTNRAMRLESSLKPLGCMKGEKTGYSCLQGNQAKQSTAHSPGRQGPQEQCSGS